MSLQRTDLLEHTKRFVREVVWDMGRKGVEVNRAERHTIEGTVFRMLTQAWQRAHGRFYPRRKGQP